MSAEYWYVVLPSGARVRGEQPRDTINRELAELIGRGWEPVGVVGSNPGLQIGVMLRKLG